MATPSSSQRYNSHYTNGYNEARMTSGYRPQGGPRGSLANLQPPGGPVVGVSASVGHDNWASDVIQAVVAGSDSPESSTSPVSVYQSTPDQKSPEHCAEWIQCHVNERKRKFHSGRPLELKNLPDGCTEQDIRDAFADVSILNVAIDFNDGRYKASAKVYLENPELLDTWPESRQNVFVKNKEVSVCVGSSDGWLCVAKLPLDFTDEEFYSLASAYGKVREAFIMISERTGSSKGYGLIKYVSSDAAAQACHLLEGRIVASAKYPNMHYTLICDWLNSSHVTFKSLHSKALYIDHLPQNYRDMGEFRRIFSVYKSPPYCQIAMPKGVIQDWGLVEFFDPIDTETTQAARNGYLIKGTPIRVNFCIPGVNAINIYMQAVNAPPDPRKKALMQDAPSADVYSQLQKLAAQNPAFAENLQTIIQEQIRSLSSGQGVLTSSTRDFKENIPKHCVKLTHANSHPTHGITQGTHPQSTPLVSSSSSNLNANAQAALMILLTAQMQSQTGETSILQNPQVVSILQNLVNQAGDPTKQNDVNISEIMENPALSAVFRSGSNPSPTLASASTVTSSAQSVTTPLQWQAQLQTAQQESVSRITLLETPKPLRPILLGDAPPGYPPVKPAQTVPVPEKETSVSPVVATNLNNLLNAQNLNQLLGSLTDVKNGNEKPIEMLKPAIRRPPGQRPVLLADPPGLPSSSTVAAPTNVTSTKSYTNFVQALPSSTIGLQVQQTLHTPTYVQPNLSSVYTTMTSSNPSQQPIFTTIFQPDPQLSSNSFLQAAQQQQKQQLMTNPFLLAGYPTPMLTASAPQPGAPQQLFYPAPGVSAFQTAYTPQAAPFTTTNALGYGTNATVLTGLPGYTLLPGPYANSAQLMPPPVTSPNSLLQTPPNIKRKLPIPPSPEASPEGSYIGQHSQGLGGHYADSYWRNKRPKH